MKRGAPKKIRCANVVKSFRLTPIEAVDIENFCVEMGVSMSDLVRASVRIALLSRTRLIYELNHGKHYE